MKLHLNLSLRRALLAAFAALSSLSYTASAGIADERYDLQYYLDFSYNKGMFAAGATNLSVFYKDGAAVSNNVIPLMPNLDSYARAGTKTTLPTMGTILEGNGGAGLVSSQFMFGAAHVYRKTSEPDSIFFKTENGNWSISYEEINVHLFGSDSGIQRLNKLVTEVAYTPMADDAFMQTMEPNNTWLYRVGNGGTWSTTGESLDTHDNALGGIINANSITNNGGDWCLKGWHRKNDGTYDTRTPLDMGVYFGDSGSPLYAWDAENNRFLQVGSMFGSNVAVGYDNYFQAHYYPSKAQELMDKYTVVADGFSGTDTIVWGVQDSATGRGTLTQGEVEVEYTGKGTDNGLGHTLGLTFSTQDTEHELNLELQGSVDMGAGAMTFSNGSWRLTETEASHTFNSAGFDVGKGAELTLELTATSAEEWRKVGEGTMTIAGSDDNEAVLRVGGGTTQYNVTYDDDGNITGCTLGNIGETRLNRTAGYAASSVRLEGGVAILVLMQGGQFKTKSVAGDTFSFGNAGGLLNLNGHNLEWGVINQDGSGKGARIGNFTPLGEQTPPGLATFTYTGTGTFGGCFMDEGSGEGKAQLAVKYNNADNGTWTLTGNHSNVGGFTVEAGTMKLQGANTPHVGMTDSNDWTYASIVGSDVSVKSGATFQLSHHALMQGNVTVESGGSFVLSQTVNAASESIDGRLRQDMSQAGIKALIGNVTLKASGSSVARMEANISSPVTTIIDGSINLDDPDELSYRSISLVKKGNGILSVTGAVRLNSVNIEEGGLVIGNGSDNGDWYKWTIGEKGFLAAIGATNIETLLSIGKITADSKGVLALTADQATQLTGDAITNGLYIGAYGDTPITYGTAGADLSANANGQWLLGGGTGTLQVDFRLTGAHDLIIGNEWSSGTVHLTNTANNFTGDIYLKGSGNKLSYVDGALGSARVNLSYSNALTLYEAEQLDIIKTGSSGVLALESNDNLDLRGTTLSLGANGEYTYSGALTVDDTYRFGGSGQLTVDTVLDGTRTMEIDGQGTTGSSVTFARENAFTGSMVAGGGLHLDTANSSGDISIHVGHEKALASAAAVELQKGAVLYTDGKSITVNNLTAQTGSSIRHNGATAATLQLNVDASVATSIADGVLLGANNGAALSLVKTGKGTLTMGTNSTWNGGLTIKEGTVAAQLAVSSADTLFGSAGGIGAASNVIYIEESGTLSVRGLNKDGRALAGTEIVQQVLGTGTIEFATGGSAFFSAQSKSFDGTVRLTGNTRIYLGSNLDYNGSGVGKNTLQSVQNATIEVTSGSQVRLTSSLFKNRSTHENIYADFVISGSGFAGKTGSSDISQLDRLTSGALAIDLASTVHGNITLADDATISSSSYGTLGDKNTQTGYGFKNHLGGTVRGRILGEGKTLTVHGNEGMTFTADSANTFGNLDIANGNGNNDDKFALRLNGGKAVSQTSTALGMGDVTLNAGLILRLAGTGVANNTDVVYTYANDITTGNNATIQSYNITNRLTGTVSMSGSTLNLATANGGVLELAGGIDGSGTLNVGAASVVSLGSAVAALSAESPQFSGRIVAGAGADITLASSSVLASSTTITGTEALTLRFGGQETYTLGSITVGASGETASSLTLSFDFTQAGAWSSLNSSVSAGVTTIELEMNMFREIAKGNYTLISSAAGNTGDYVLADDMNGRLSLVTNAEGALVLTVDADNRLVWRTDGVSSVWNGTDANWYSDKVAGMTTFSSKADVALNASGVAADNSAEARETISLNDSLQVGSMIVQEAAYEVTGSGAISGQSLAVGQGGDLKLSNTGGNSFTEGVIVNDGSLEVSGSVLTAEVTAENGASFTLSENASMNGNLSLEQAEAEFSQSSLNGNINLAGACEVRMDNATLNGVLGTEAGNVTLGNAKLSGDFQSGSGVLQSNSLNILSGSVTTNAALEMGHLSLTDGSLQINAAAAIDKLSIAAGKTVTLWNATAAAGADKVLGIAELGNNAILQTNDRDVVSAATTIGTVKLTGTTATVQDVHHSGGYAIHNIEGAADSTLVLAKNATSNNVAVFTLGSATETTDAGSQFAGTILLKQQNATSDGNRDVALILNHGTVAQKATINLASAQQSNPKVALGINVAEATIGGLDSGEALGNRAIVFSGNQAANSGWQTPGANASVNTLIISTAADTTHNFYGQVQNVNLVIDGEGTQKFLGSGDNFTGSLSIQGGTAVFYDSSFSMLNNASSLAVGSGTLDVSAIDFADAANAIRVDSGRSISFADKSTVAFGGMEADTEYGVFDISGGELEGWTDLSASNFTIDGVRLSDMGRVVLNLGMTGGFSYTIEDGWDLVWNGGESKQIWNQNEANPVWKTTRPDDTTGELVETSVGYKNNDNVVFNSDADLELEGNIRVNNMTVADGVNLKTNGNLTITGALNVGSNVSWSFSGDTSLSFTETQLQGFAALEVGEGATLTMTNKETAQNNTSTAFNKVSGAGNVVLNLSTTDNGVGFNFGKITGDITVATGRLQVNTSTFNAASDIYLTTSDSQLVFNGSGTELKNDVVLGASTTIHVNSGTPQNCSGTISGTISGSQFGLTKAGGGSLTLAGQTTLGSLLINGGSVTVSNGMTLDGTDRLQLEANTKLLLADGASITRTTEAASWIRGSMEVLENASAAFTSIDDVHLSYDNGNNKGSIVLRKNSRLAMDVDILSFYNGSSISMETKAELQLTKSKAHISNRGDANATITASSTGARSAQTYSMGNSNFAVSNAHFKSVATVNATLSNKLVNSSVENAGSGKLTVSHASNSITDVYASAGDMAVMQQAAGLNLDELVVASGKTVSVYTGTEATAAAEANVTVSKRAEFGAGAVLNANLTLAAGTTLEVGVGGLTMGSTLTLNQGLTLGDDTLSRVQGLSVGESTTLFRGVDGLTLADTSYTTITTEDSILASPWFTNLTGDQYVLTYTGTDNGSLSITMMSAAVPEPTTATLSLLALAALAARRRRK